MIRIAIVDDQALVRDGLSMMISAEVDLEVVCEAANGRDLLDALEAGQPIDVALLDLRMPVMDGVTTLTHLRHLPTPPAVLVVTTFEHDDLVLEAIASGADGYVLKRDNRQNLVKAIRTIARGHSILAPEVTNAVLAKVRRQPSTIPINLNQYHLTSRELDVLRLVGCGLTNDEIANQLNLSTHTIKSHITSLLTKTESRDRTQAALLAVRGGLS